METLRELIGDDWPCYLCGADMAWLDDERGYCPVCTTAEERKEQT
jgi:hypothetical protein